MYHGSQFYNWSPRPMSEKARRYHENMRKREEGRKAAAERRRQVFLNHVENQKLFAKLQEMAPRRNFAQSLLDSIERYGSLTDGQLNAAKRMIAAEQLKAEQRAAENALLAEQSDYVGEVGERREFVLSIDRVFDIGSRYYGFGQGHQFVSGHVMHDSDGNVFVYFGNKLGDAGQAVRGKATVKRHDVRDGVKQTVISRPKMEVIDYGQDDHSTDDIVDDIQAAGAQ